MKGNTETLNFPDTDQGESSVNLEAANANTPVVVQLDFPIDKLITLQRQSVSAPPVAMNPRGMTRTVAASYVGCSPRKFDTMVETGEMPQPRLIGSKKVWDRIELDDFFEALPKPSEIGNDWDEG